MLFLCLVILDFDYDRSLKHIFCLSCKFYFPGDISCGKWLHWVTLVSDLSLRLWSQRKIKWPNEVSWYHWNNTAMYFNGTRKHITMPFIYIISKRLWVQCGTAECGIRKVKWGMKNAERRWLVHRSDHVTAAITQFTTCRACTRSGKLRNVM